MPEQLADIKTKAIDQLDQYSADPALVAKWHLGTEMGSDKSVASPKGATLGEAALSPLHNGPLPSTGSCLCSTAATAC